MVTKKRTPQRARRRAPVRRAAPRRRAKSGTTAIPGAMATVGLLYANKDALSSDINYFMKYGLSKGINYAQRSQIWKKYLSAEQLTKDAIFTGGAYVAGEVAKKYLPGVVKRPLGKIAKKIPKVL